MEALQRTANRGSISTGPYEIDNSVQMNSVTVSDPPRFNRTNSAAGNRKTFTISFWHKRGHSAHSNTVGYRVLNSIRNESGKYPGLFVFDYRGDVNSTQFLSAFADEDPDNVAEAWFKSDMSFRDESAWYHIVIAYDTTQGTASNRRAMYVNGVEQTYSQSGDIPQHHQSSWNDDTLHCIGAYEYNLSDASLGGYLAEVHNIDGLKLDASYFGEFDTSGIWKPKEYDGNYGTNGFRLQFKETGTGQNASGLGADTSGNDHHFATVGHTAASQATDTPTNNFCTLMPPQASITGTATVVSNGGTTMISGTTAHQNAFGSMGVRSGKWYFESNVSNLGGVASYSHFFGVIAADRITALNNGSALQIGGVANTWGFTSNNRGNTGNTENPNFPSESATSGTTEVMGIALDMDNGKVWVHKAGTYATNNSSVTGNPATGAAPQYDNLLTAIGGEHILVGGGVYASNNSVQRDMNFGNPLGHANFTNVGTHSDANGYGSFAYAPPSGYYALCTKNLAEFG